MDAEKQKAESGAEHQKKAKVFQEAELKVSITRNTDPGEIILKFDNTGICELWL